METQTRNLKAELARLSPEKRLLLQLLRKRKEEGAQDLQPVLEPKSAQGTFSLLSEQDRSVLPEGLEDAYPMASMQVGMLYHTALTRGEELPAYHNVFFFDLELPVQVKALWRALQHLVERHAIFRTSFDLKTFSQPMQLVHRQVQVALPVIDLLGLPPARQERELRSFLLMERRNVHDYRRPPLLRFYLHRLAAEKSRLTMTESHTVAEGWGTYQTLGELYEIYAALSTGSVPPTLGPSQGVLYRDFIRLEQEALHSSESKEYWARKLTEVAPTRVPRWSPGAVARRRNHLMMVPKPLLQKLLVAGRRLEVPFKSLLLAVHLKALSIFCGQRQVMAALHVHGRPEGMGGEYVRGVFNNTVPFGMRILPGTWAELIRATFENEMDFMPHRRYPWAAMQRDSGDVTAIEIQIGYTHFHLFGELTAPAGVSVPTTGELDRSIGHFPFMLYFTGSGTGPQALQMFFGVSDRSVSQIQVQWLIRCYLAVLEAIGEDLEAPHHQMSALERATRHQLLVEWNPPPIEAPRHRLLHEGVFEWAARAADRVALVADDTLLTYAELERRVRRLAADLRVLGVGSEVRIGLCMERSAALVVGLLGVLEAGGAYVPLDPAYPAQHREVILADSEIPILLTGQTVPPGASLGSTSRSPGAVRGENLAYVIYTSGSTGRPKGVAVTHASAVALLDWAGEIYTEADLDGVLAGTSVCFDLSVFEIFVPLNQGGRVILVADLLALPRHPARDQVRLLNTVPSAMSELVRSKTLGERVRTVNLAGEPLSRYLVDGIHAFPQVERVFNLYGPSEDTTYSTWSKVPLESTAEPTIGRAVSGSWAFVLDEHLCPQPCGISGELYLGGAGLARGYWGRPALTAERFLPDAWSGAVGGRLYRTGDRVRWLLTGELDFLGRVDHQVKVRGFRIELGQIERALETLSSVQEAVVKVWEPTPGDRRLVAYVVPEDAGATIAKLRAGLGATLPTYMLPTAFVFLDALPLTPNGKIDRKALPEPHREVVELARELEVPRSPSQELIASTWEEVLGIERVGLRDNFFELGGHSLTAMQVASRLAGLFNVDVEVRILFDHPTVAALAHALEALRHSTAQKLPELTAKPTGEPPEASFSQQRLWFIDRLEPGTSAYNMPSPVRVDGPLSLPALEAALREVVRRHHVLRTTFSESAGRPLPLVAAAATVDLPLIDLSWLPREMGARVLAREVAAAGLRPFDLARGPILRVSVLRLGSEEHVVTLTVHHIASDGWSLGILAHEATTLYEAFSAGKTSPLPELPIQYSDFAYWQRRRLSGELLARELDYWTGRLNGLPALLELPTDRPRRAFQRSRVAVERLVIGGGLNRDLRRLARQAGATPFMVMLATFEVLLSRMSGQTDLGVGIPVAGRNHVATEGLIGLFVNTLVLRADTAGDPSFRGFLAQVRERLLEAHDHQELPFEQLVDALDVERNLGQSPLFQVLVVSGVMLPARSQIESDSAKWTPVDTGEWREAQFDLVLSLQEQAEQIVALFEFRTELFDATTLRRLAQAYGILLGAVREQPDTRLSQLSCQDAAQRHQLLVEWNAAVDPARVTEMGLHERVWAVARRAADRIAVSTSSETAEQYLSYGELEHRSRCLAAYLVGRGIGREDVVAIFCRRSPEMILAMLGVLGAGATYLPCEPALPAERLRYFLEDSGAVLVLTREDSLEKLAEAGAEVFCLDRDWMRISQAHLASAVPLPAIHQRQGAYLIYTSGSTGRPKGVLVEHRSASLFVEATTALYGIDQHDYMLQNASFSFDISIEEIFDTLSGGATLVQLPEKERYAAHGFLAAARRRRITIFDFATSYWHGLTGQLASSAEKVPPSVRLVIIGGEAVQGPLLEKWLEQVGHEVLVLNSYGPTEATVACIWTDLRHVVERVAIGRPQGISSAYVFDRDARPVSLGLAGELFLGGAGLTRGYLRRPALTASRFLPDSLGGEPGGRLYRTGDLVRWNPAGELEFLGRLDHQVKVRGFRIELGEVEAALLAQPGVRAAAVAVWEAGSSNARLAAYVVLEGRPSSPEGLKQALARVLPEHMVPTSIVFLETLPLTANGKVDRKRLLRPVSAEGQERASEAPRTPTEGMVAAVWEEVLRVPSVGVEDDFFALGGHSLVAMQVISRLQTSFGIELPVRSVFEHPRVAGLAQFIDGQRRGQRGMSRPVLERVSREVAGVSSFAQQRLWFIDQLEPGSSAYNMATPVELLGLLAIAALRAALGSLVVRHEVLRTHFTAVGGRPVPVVSEASLVPLGVVDLEALAADRRESCARELMEAEALQPFDLARGPVLRVRLLRLAAERHVLLLTLHHIASDGWSMGILAREITRFYDAHLQGEESSLAPLPVQYADYAAWQRGWLSGEVLAAEQSYWGERLSGLPPLLELPVDRPRGALAKSSLGQVEVVLEASVSRFLIDYSRQMVATPFMLVLAALKVLLGRLSGQWDLCVGMPVAGRGHADVEGLIGFFVNTLVLRTKISGNPRFSDLLMQVREGLLEAYDHQDLPFERLVEILEVERSLEYSPLFQVLVVSGVTMPGVSEHDQSGLRWRPLNAGGSRSAQFDWTLSVEEARGGLSLWLEYRRDVFDLSTMQRVSRGFSCLLGAVASDASCRLEGLPWYTRAERHQLLEEWGCGGGLSLAAPWSLPALLSAQVSRTPERVALVVGDAAYSYAELDRRARAVAAALVARGAGPEVCIAVCMERGVELVVSILGILRTGSAYVPLDPGYPEQHREFVLADCSAAFCVTAEDRLTPFGAQALVLADAALWLRPENLAYVIYTSGSTGTPKGVSVTHGNAVSLIAWSQEVFSEDELEGVVAGTSVCFDLSIFELFVPLARGGCVVLVRDVLELSALGSRDRVRLLNTVPSAMTELVRMNGLGLGLRTVNLAGEALARPLVDSIYGGSQVERVLNLYGPSEDTTYSTWAAALAGESSAPTIGRAVSGTRCYVLDRSLGPLAAGVAGELYLAGAGLSRGYLGRAGLTAQRYLPDPFDERGGRMYRTGDRVRFRRDGQLQFLGRLDHQVKVRGFRIELGEVEAALLAQPGVRAAAVVVREMGGDPRLVAYFTTAAESVDVDGLARGLKDRLPEYLVPAFFVPLEALPLTPNGKVDRKALPQPGQGRWEAETIPPRDELELLLTRIWQELLGLDRLGVTTSFFALGGHSLLAVQLLARIEAETGRSLPIQVLFEHATIERLAQILREGDATLPTRSILVPLEKRGDGPPIFLVHPVGGHVFSYLELARQLGPGRPIFGIQSPEPEDIGPFSVALEEIAARYLEEVLAVAPTGPYHFGGWSIGGVIAYEMAQQLRRAGREVATLAMFDTHVPDQQWSQEISEKELAYGFFTDLLALTRQAPERFDLGEPKAGESLAELLYRRACEARALPPGVGLDRVQHHFRIYATNLRATSQYRPEPYLGEVNLFRAADTTTDPTLGWGDLVQGAFELSTVKGGHYGMLSPPHVEELARCLRDRLGWG